MSNRHTFEPKHLRLLALAMATACSVLAFMVSPHRASAANASDLPSNDAIYQTIADLVSHGPRRQGTPALDFAVNYVADKMRSYGLSDVHVEDSQSYAWQADSSSLTVGGASVDAFPVAFSNDPGGDNEGVFGTPPEGLTAPIVDVGNGASSDFSGKDVRGKIVMFNLKFQLPLAGMLPISEFIYDPTLSLFNWKTLFTANPYMTNYRTAIQNAMDNGAAGFVGVLSDYFNSNRYFNEYYSRMHDSLPGMWVTATAGSGIRARLKTTPSLPATIQLTTQRRKAPAHSVVGIVQGRSNDTILISSHHDSVWQGAVEDGSGTAEVLALAKYYGSLPASSRTKTLMFMTDDSHFTGYQAHGDFIRRHIFERDPQTDPHRLVADVAIEHIGKAASIASDGSLKVSNQPEPRGIFETLNPLLKLSVINAVASNDLRRTAVLNADLLQPVGIPTDVSGLVMAGLPVVSLISGPAYMYDEQDTLDKVAKDQLRPVAATFADIVDSLDRAYPTTIGHLPLSVTLGIGQLLLNALTSTSS